MDDLLSVGCKVMTIGQYLAPTKDHLQVVEYITPEKFEEYKNKFGEYDFGDKEYSYEYEKELGPGILGIGIVMLGMFGFLVYKKVINWITTTSMIGSLLVISFIIALFNGYNVVYYPLFQLFGGMFLFVAIFFASDPITTPIPTIGKVLFGILVGAITMFIRNGDTFMNGTYIQGVVFAVLFMSMLTPLLNV